MEMNKDDLVAKMHDTDAAVRYHVAQRIDLEYLPKMIDDEDAGIQRIAMTRACALAW